MEDYAISDDDCYDDDCGSFDGFEEPESDDQCPNEVASSSKVI